MLTGRKKIFLYLFYLFICQGQVTAKLQKRYIRGLRVKLAKKPKKGIRHMNLGFLIIHPIKHSNYVKSLLHLCSHSEKI